jgi:hypothetical protein|tara:strand:+ start:124193 stop:125719 length:1527 start_codon:yes stop_codon:yes gene_type:complete
VPRIYGFPSIVFGFHVEEGTLSAWSSNGFDYSVCSQGSAYHIFMGEYADLAEKTTAAKVPEINSVVISSKGEVEAPAFFKRSPYVQALQAYRAKFPDRKFDHERNDILFFPEAVTILDYTDYGYEGMNYAFRYSLESGETEDLESKNIGVCRIFPCGICVHKVPRGGRYMAVDDRLNELWSIAHKDYGMDSCPINITRGPTADTVLLNLGYIDEKDQYGHDNDVALMALSSGQCLWKVTFPHVVNSIWSDKDYVYVSSKGSAYVLDPASGKIVKQLKNVFGIASNQARYQQNKIYESALKSALISDGRHLYLFNTSYLFDRSMDCAEFWIFDLETLECLRHDELPKGLVVHRRVEPRFLNGKLYVSMRRSFWGNEGGALIEFDPDDIHSPFVCDVDVFFGESIRQNGEAQEYVLTTDHESLSEALRYGESELINLAIAQGRCVFSKKVKNPAFNGVIHFALKKALLSEAGAEEKLAVLMKRLNAWGQSGYYASDGKTFVSFQWEASVL